MYCTARQAALLVFALCALAACGCVHTRYQTDTAASSTQQLLLAESIERAVEQLELPEVRGRSFSVDVSAIPSAHADYLASALAGRLAQHGGRRAEPQDAELRISALVGAIGTTSSRSAFGVPSVPIPSLGATPDIPLVSGVYHRGWTRVRLLAWDARGVLLSSSPSVTERARYDVITLLFFDLLRNDVYPSVRRMGLGE